MIRRLRARRDARRAAIAAMPPEQLAATIARRLPPELLPSRRSAVSYEQIVRAIGDPGSHLPRRWHHLDDPAVRRPESVTEWSARAVLLVLGYPQPVLTAGQSDPGLLVQCPIDNCPFTGAHDHALFGGKSQTCVDPADPRYPYARRATFLEEWSEKT